MRLERITSNKLKENYDSILSLLQTIQFISYEKASEILKKVEKNMGEFRYSYVMKNENRVIGILISSLEDKCLDSKKLHLCYIAIDELYHGKQIGKMMLENLEQEALQYGMSKIALSTYENNIRARNFYGKMGYIPVMVGDELQTIIKDFGTTNQHIDVFYKKHLRL